MLTEKSHKMAIQRLTKNYFVHFMVNLKKYCHPLRRGSGATCGVLFYYWQQKKQNKELFSCHLPLHVPEFALSLETHLTSLNCPFSIHICFSCPSYSLLTSNSTVLQCIAHTFSGPIRAEITLKMTCDFKARFDELKKIIKISHYS